MKQTIVQDKETLRQQLLLLNKTLFAWDTETNSTREDNKDFNIKYCFKKQAVYESNYGCPFKEALSTWYDHKLMIEKIDNVKRTGLI